VAAIIYLLKKNLTIHKIKRLELGKQSINSTKIKKKRENMSN